MHIFLMAVGSVLLLCTSIVNIVPYKIKFHNLILMGAVILGISCLLLRFGEVYSIIPFLAVPIIVIGIRSSNFIKSSISIIIAVILMVTIDFLSGNLFSLVTGNGKEEIRSDLLIYYQYILMAWVLLFLISKIIGNYLNKKKRLYDFELKGKISIIFAVSLLLTLIIFYINVHIDSNKDYQSDLVLLKSLVFLVYFIMVMIIFYIFYKNTMNEVKIENKENNFLQLQEYTENLEKLYSDMRAFRHDYINILASMAAYINEKDIEGLERYFNQKIYPMSEFMEERNFKLAVLKNMLLPELKGIIYIKLIHAQELGVDVSIEISEPIEAVHMDIVDLSRVMGILLDNAIEASVKSENPYINLAIIKRKKSIIFVIANSYFGEIQMDKIFKKGYSTKGEGRGVGLSNIRSIFDKYTYVSLETRAADGEFQYIIDII